MARDRVIGAALVVGAVIGVIIYGILVFLPATSLIVLQISAFVAVLAVLAILGWIGYVMATTPPPVPLEPEPTAAPAQGTTSGTMPTSEKPEQQK
jgi:predicted DNA-binding transcriptional regulator